MNQLTTVSYSPALTPEKLSGWFLDWLDPKRCKQKVTSIALAHMVEGSAEVIFSEPWKAPPTEEALLDSIDEIVRRCQEGAMADVVCYDRPQRYRTVVSGGATGVNAMPLAHLSFLLAPPMKNGVSADGLASDMTEGPNAVGALSLSMRLTEATTRTSLLAAQELLRMANEEIDRLRADNARLSAQMMGQVTQYMSNSERQLRATEELINRKFERDLKLQEVAGKSEAERRAWGFVEMIAPAMVERVTGGQVPKEATAGILGMLGQGDESPAAAPRTRSDLIALLHSLTPEQQEKISQTLTIEQYEMLEKAAKNEASK